MNNVLKPKMNNCLIILNKPFGVLCQFTDDKERKTLSDYLPIKNVYPAGRLDYDSEGLVLLTNDGMLQAKISQPKFKLPKTYLVQVEGIIHQEAMNKLANGILLKDGFTLPAKVIAISEPKNLWEREPPIRFRKNIPTSWIQLTICEGRNRQVRRMTAAVGFPTLRLIRVQVGNFKLDNLSLGSWKYLYGGL